jgi:hypothetical protein
MLKLSPRVCESTDVDGAGMYIEHAKQISVAELGIYVKPRYGQDMWSV